MTHTQCCLLSVYALDLRRLDNGKRERETEKHIMALSSRGSKTSKKKKKKNESKEECNSVPSR